MCARARVCVRARAVLYYIYVRGDADARADGVNIPLYAVAILCAAARVSGGGAGAHAIGLACGGDFGFAEFFSRGFGAHALELLPGRFLLARERGGFGVVLGVALQTLAVAGGLTTNRL